MKDDEATVRALAAALTERQRADLRDVCLFVNDPEPAGLFTNAAFPLKRARALERKGLLDWMWMPWADNPYRADGSERAHQRGFFPTPLGRAVNNLLNESAPPAEGPGEGEVE